MSNSFFKWILSGCCFWVGRICRHRPVRDFQPISPDFQSEIGVDRWIWLNFVEQRCKTPWFEQHKTGFHLFESHSTQYNMMCVLATEIVKKLWGWTNDHSYIMTKVIIEIAIGMGSTSALPAQVIKVSAFVVFYRFPTNATDGGSMEFSARKSTSLMFLISNRCVSVSSVLCLTRYKKTSDVTIDHNGTRSPFV